MNELEFNEVEQVVEIVMDDYNKKREIDGMTMFHQPDQDKVVEIVNKLLRIFFPGFYRDEVYKIFNMRHTLAALVEDVMFNLQKQVTIALKNEPSYAQSSENDVRKKAKEITIAFMKQVPRMREYIDTDLDAMFDGDPAANSKNEIILCYPGLLASTIHRIAHVLWELEVPLIPRMMTEYAHSLTGIDIHPGATVGPYFFIDHGTGVVIGETTVIGEHVKLYQGVTLGAKSFAVKADGTLVKGNKRHPNIGSNVVIYAGATILGGDTYIGDNCVIGGNVWLTHSVEPGKRVLTAREQTEFVTTDI